MPDQSQLQQSARTDFLDYLNTVYEQTNEHLREQDTKRDQVIAFYVVLLSFVITSGSLLAKAANMGIIYIGLMVVGLICVNTMASLRSWHQQYLDCIAVINWVKAHQADYPTVESMQAAIQMQVKANYTGTYGVSLKSTDNWVYFGMVVLTGLPALFVAKAFNCDLMISSVLVIAYVILTLIWAVHNLSTKVTDGLGYATWSLWFDYPPKQNAALIYENQYMSVSLEAGDVLHVTQKTGGVVVLVHSADDFLLLQIRRHGKMYLECPRGFREATDHGGLSAAKRELSEELGIEPNDFGAKYNALGQVLPDSNLLTTNIQVVDVALTAMPQWPQMKLQVSEGIEAYQLHTLAELQQMIGTGAIVDGFTIAAVGKYVGKQLGERSVF